MKSSPERLSLGSLVGYLYIRSCDPHCCLCQGDLFGSVTSSGSWIWPWFSRGRHCPMFCDLSGAFDVGNRSDVASESEGVDEALEDDANEDTESDEGQHGLQEQGSSRDWWGARMTKAAMVPPVTRKYEVIEEYRIVEDKERVEQKMKVLFPVLFHLLCWDYCMLIYSHYRKLMKSTGRHGSLSLLFLMNVIV